MECQYCKKNFPDKYALKTHQTKTKYCLEIQGKVNKEFVCACKKSFLRKHQLINHQNICQIFNTPEILEYKDENKNLKTEILILQNKLEDALLRENKYEKKIENQEKQIKELYDKLYTTSTINNTINNNNINNINNIELSIFDKSDKDIEQIVIDKYDKNYLVQGQKGMAIFTCKYVINNNPPIYIITDKSRRNGKYKISETEIVNDQGFAGLGKKVYKPIRKKAQFIIRHEEDFMENEVLKSGFNDLIEFENNNNNFRRCIVEEFCSS